MSGATGWAILTLIFVGLAFSGWRRGRSHWLKTGGDIHVGALLCQLVFTAAAAYFFVAMLLDAGVIHR